MLPAITDATEDPFWSSCDQSAHLSQINPAIDCHLYEPTQSGHLSLGSGAGTTEGSNADYLDVESGSSAALDPYEVSELEFGLSASDVVARIEDLIASAVEELSQGCKVPSLELISRQQSNILRAGEGEDDVSDVHLKFGSKTEVRSLLHNAGAGAHKFARGALMCRAVQPVVA